MLLLARVPIWTFTTRKTENTCSDSPNVKSKWFNQRSDLHFLSVLFVQFSTRIYLSTRLSTVSSLILLYSFTFVVSSAISGCRSPICLFCGWGGHKVKGVPFHGSLTVDIVLSTLHVTECRLPQDIFSEDYKIPGSSISLSFPLPNPHLFITLDSSPLLFIKVRERKGRYSSRVISTDSFRSPSRGIFLLRSPPLTRSLRRHSFRTGRSSGLRTDVDGSLRRHVRNTWCEPHPFHQRRHSGLSMSETLTDSSPVYIVCVLKPDLNLKNQNSSEFLFIRCWYNLTTKTTSFI